MWNGWRATYVQSGGESDVPAGKGSVFTRILNSGLSDDETNIVHRGPTCFAILNAFPYGTGHTLVLPVPRGRRPGGRSTPDETAELWATVDRRRAWRSRRPTSPMGSTSASISGAPAGGSVSEHLHVHVVPRWTGDANFMTTVANTRTLPGSARRHGARRSAPRGPASRLRPPWI